MISQAQVESQEQVESDPIHGSLGPAPIRMEDLGPDAAFEESQRRKRPI